MSRAKRVREIPEVAAATRRMVRALGRRIGEEGDPADLAELLALRADVEDAIRSAVRAQHDGPGFRPGFSWGEIAAGMGVTRQGVQQRYGSVTSGEARSLSSV